MNSILLITASLILLAGVIDDMRSRKVHNWLFLACAASALIASVGTGGWMGLNSALMGFGAGFILCLPLVLAHVIGAGDMKLIAAFGAAAGWNATVNVVIFSLIWGAIFGVVQVILKGQLKATLTNMVAIVSQTATQMTAPKGERKTLELHKIPFTVAFLMGWLTQLVHLGVMR